ncbi:rhodanese-like domain-containing protein [Thalassolituus sp. LLYu03]|uniref:rhodanese-like domain-containing protein n=1 Tax=Thalassolituus sp. LLYu03 TaxID=3421656 RepID=UPI003D281C71
MEALYTIAFWLFTTVAFAAEAVWIDVRTPQEYQSGHKEGAYNLPHNDIGESIGALNLSKDAEINLYCRSGKRAGMAKATLEALGYQHVTNIGGLNDALSFQASQSSN